MFLVVILGGANTHPLENFDPLIPKGTTHLLLANEIVLDSTISYLTTAASQSITTIFNPSPMPSSSELRSFPFHQLDWLIVNEGELASIFKSLVGEPLPASNNPEESIKNSMKLFSKLSSRTGIICTLGPQGVLFVRPSPGSEGGVQTGHLPAAKLENALKDTTGAGDCFMGFFAAGLAKSEQKAGSKEKDISDEAFEEILKTCLTVRIFRFLISCTLDVSSNVVISGMFDVC
jgi:ribokinase